MAALKESLAAADEIGLSREKTWVFDTDDKGVPNGLESWETLLESPESSEDWIRFDDLERAKRTPAAMQFSSGTTGLPKAAILSHYNFVAEHTLVYEIFPRSYQVGSACIHVEGILREGLDDTTYTTSTFPCWLRTGYSYQVYQHSPRVVLGFLTSNSALRAGVPTYIMRRFELMKYVHYIYKYQVTDLMLVPPMAVAMINCPLLKDPKYLKSVRWGFAGAAPLKVSIQNKLRRLMPHAAFTQIFGMTETTCIGMMTPYGEDDDTASVGRPIPGVEAK